MPRTPRRQSPRLKRQLELLTPPPRRLAPRRRCRDSTSFRAPLFPVLDDAASISSESDAEPNSMEHDDVPKSKGKPHLSSKALRRTPMTCRLDRLSLSASSASSSWAGSQPSLVSLESLETSKRLRGKMECAASVGSVASYWAASTSSRSERPMGEEYLLILADVAEEELNRQGLLYESKLKSPPLDDVSHHVLKEGLSVSSKALSISIVDVVSIGQQNTDPNKTVNFVQTKPVRDLSPLQLEHVRQKSVLSTPRETADRHQLQRDVPKVEQKPALCMFRTIAQHGSKQRSLHSASNVSDNLCQAEPSPNKVNKKIESDLPRSTPRPQSQRTAQSSVGHRSPALISTKSENEAPWPPEDHFSHAKQPSKHRGKKLSFTSRDEEDTRRVEPPRMTAATPFEHLETKLVRGLANRRKPHRRRHGELSFVWQRPTQRKGHHSSYGPT